MQSSRALLHRYTKDLGFSKIFEASSVKEAWSVIEGQNGEFDLIITDHHLGITTGLEFLQKLKSMDQYKGIPVIFMTSDNEKSLVLDAIEFGAINYLMKPYTFDGLKEKIAKVFVQ